MLYASAANTLAKRAIGANGDILTVSGGVPTWSTSLPVTTTIPFGQIASGTNTTAAMQVGTGASLAPTGTGTITANQYASATSASNSIDLDATSAEVSGILPLANGGTGTSTGPVGNGIIFGNNANNVASTSYTSSAAPASTTRRYMVTSTIGTGAPAYGPEIYYGQLVPVAPFVTVYPIANTNVVAGSIINVTYQDVSSSGQRTLYVTAVTPGTGFTVTISAAPAVGASPVINYTIINP